MSMDGQVPNGEEKLPKISTVNGLSRVHERHRQTTDGRAIAYSEREREFTFAKNSLSRNVGVMQRELLYVGTE